MKVTLKLSRSQYKGVVTIVMNCCNALAGESLREVEYRDALWKLQVKLAGKVPTLKGHNQLTLGELETLALFDVVGDLVERFGPYEMGLGYWMLAEIDRQRMEYVSLMRQNIVNEQQNLIASNAI